ncbi:MAG: type II toxin-antitoxin system HicB family antitoxin [Bryobacteraceae bacterium]|jgi:antitoxin HicB
MLSYPARFTADREAGGYVISFPDVPEAVTQAESVEEGMEMAADCLELILGEYIRLGRPIPPPSVRKRGHRSIRLPFFVALKVELYDTWLHSGVKKAELAHRLGMPRANVDRLFDLKHVSRPEQMEGAFAALGKQVDIQVRSVA